MKIIRKTKLTTKLESIPAGTIFILADDPAKYLIMKTDVEPNSCECTCVSLKTGELLDFDLEEKVYSIPEEKVFLTFIE